MDSFRPKICTEAARYRVDRRWRLCTERVTVGAPKHLRFRPNCPAKKDFVGIQTLTSKCLLSFNISSLLFTKYTFMNKYQIEANMWRICQRLGTPCETSQTLENVDSIWPTLRQTLALEIFRTPKFEKSWAIFWRK